MKAKVMVSELLNDYVRHCELKPVKNLQAARYAVRLLTEGMGSLVASTVTPQIIEAWMQQMTQAGYAQGSVDRFLTVLRAALRYGLENCKFSHVPKIPMFHPDNARQGFCEPAEFQEILAKIESPVVRDLAEFAYYSGRRPGELHDMRWEDVYPDQRIVRLPRTKNRRPWIVPLEGPLASIMDRRISSRNGCDHVFHLDGHPVSVSQRSRAWEKAAAAAGYPSRLFYDLRRTAARDMIDAGVDPTTVKQSLGHVTDSSFHRYNIRNTDDQRRAILRMVAFRQGRMAQGTVVESCPL